MRTEIVVPFAFDTTPIEERLREHGEEEVERLLRQLVHDQVIAALPKKTDYYGHKTKVTDWSGIMKSYFLDWLNDHSQEIIDEAALLMAARAAQKRPWREVLASIKEDGNDA